MFPEGKTIGLRIGLLPIEEYLFMFVVPFLIITLYKVVDGAFIRKQPRKKKR